MKKRSRTTKGFSHKLIALLLCCICLVTASSYALAMGTDTAAESQSDGYGVDVYATFNGTLTIDDTIQTNGRLTANANPSGDYTYTWEKSTDGTNWEAVTRTKVTGDLYNMAADGSWINVALDGGARCYYRVTVDTVTSAQYQVPYYKELQNGSFETPVIDKMQINVTGGTNNVVWKTTAQNGLLEFVNTKAEGSDTSFKWHGVYTAADGDQCAEINADYESALYQDVLTIPGSTMYWQLSHLGRSMNSGSGLVIPTGRDTVGKEQTDTMYVLIMPYASAQNITTQDAVQNVMNNLGSYPGAKVETITYTWRWTRADRRSTTYTMQHKVGDNWVDTFRYSSETGYKQLVDPWEVHTGNYTVPADQYLTRYFFVSGPTAYDAANPTADNLHTVGNHIDKVWFSTDLPAPNPGSANLTIKKTIDVDNWDGLTTEQQQKFIDAVSFTYQVDNGEEVTIPNAEATISWIKNEGTFQVNIPVEANSSVNVKVTENLKDVDGYIWNGDKDKMTQEITLDDQDSETVEFTNPYTIANKLLTIKKTVSGNMHDENKTFPFTVTANQEMTLNKADGTTETGTSLTFALKKNDSVTISVPVGANVKVTENADGYKFTVGQGTTIPNTNYTMDTNGISFTMPGEDATVVFNNAKDITVDTGVMLDSLPYVLILAVVVIGGAVVMHKRRHHGDN